MYERFSQSGERFSFNVLFFSIFWLDFNMVRFFPPIRRKNKTKQKKKKKSKFLRISSVNNSCKNMFQHIEKSKVMVILALST